MAEEKEDQKAEAQALPAPARRKTHLIVGGAIFALVIGIGAPVGYFLLRPPPEKVEDVKIEQLEEEQPVLEGSEDPLELEEGEEPLGAIVPFETFLVNLSGGKYIRLQAQVEFETPDVPKKFYSRMVPIRDAIITMLTQQSAADLEDGKGKEKLKKSIRDIINDRLRREDVRRVYFTQFVIQ